MNKITITVMTATLAVALLTSCSTVGGKVNMTTAGVESSGQLTKSESYIATDGSQTASHSGLGPTLTKQDDGGNWVNSSMPMNLFTFDPITGKYYISSHADSSVEMNNPNMSRDENGPTFTADSLKIVIGSSEPIRATTLSYEAAFLQIQGLTTAQAQVEIQRMLTLGQITTDIATGLLAQLATGGL